MTDIKQIYTSHQSLVGTVTPSVIRTVPFSLGGYAPSGKWYSPYNFGCYSSNQRLALACIFVYYSPKWLLESILKSRCSKHTLSSSHIVVFFKIAKLFDSLYCPTKIGFNVSKFPQNHGGMCPMVLCVHYTTGQKHLYIVALRNDGLRPFIMLDGLLTCAMDTGLSIKLNKKPKIAYKESVQSVFKKWCVRLIDVSWCQYA